MKKEVILFIFLIFLSALAIYINSAQAIVINEVMPNPFDNCSDCTEWLELYSNISQDLENYTLNTGESKNLSINATIQDYLVITKNKTVFLEYWQIPPEKVLELAIGLTNSGDSITLYQDNETIDSFTWSKDIYNSSWSKQVNGTLIPCSQVSPGSQNNCQNQENQSQDNESQEQEESPHETESIIQIKDSPDEAKFGDIIEIDLKAYRGDTSKYAVYIYVQDADENRVSDKKTIHVHDMYDTYRGTIKLALDCLNESGTYKIVAQGLDERDTMPIDLESCYRNEEIIDTTNKTDTIISQSPTPITNQAIASIPSSKTMKSSSMSFLSILLYVLLAVIIILIIYFIFKR